jgi:hypothetical protein
LSSIEQQSSSEPSEKCVDKSTQNSKRSTNFPLIANTIEEVSEHKSQISHEEHEIANIKAESNTELAKKSSMTIDHATDSSNNNNNKIRSNDCDNNSLNKHKDCSKLHGQYFDGIMVKCSDLNGKNANKGELVLKEVESPVNKALNKSESNSDSSIKKKKKLLVYFNKSLDDVKFKPLKMKKNTDAAFNTNSSLMYMDEQDDYNYEELENDYQYEDELDNDYRTSVEELEQEKFNRAIYELSLDLKKSLSAHASVHYF